MSTISVSVYEITVYKKNKSSELHETLSDFNNGTDLIKLFQKLPALLSNGTSTSAFIDDSKNSKRLRINSSEFKPFGRIIDGEVETGDYGVESPLVDSKGTTVGKIQKEHAPMKPFYFLCELPKNEKKGFLMLQRFRQYGVFTMFTEAVRKEFNKVNSDYTIRFNPIASKKEYDRIIKNGQVKRVSLKTSDVRQVSKSINIKNLNDQFNYEDVYLEVNLVAKKDRSINLKNSLSKLISGSDEKMNDLFQFSGYENGQLKVLMQINGKSHTMDMSRWENFAPDIDISSKVSLDKTTGLPITSEVRTACLELLDDLKKQK